MYGDERMANHFANEYKYVPDETKIIIFWYRMFQNHFFLVLGT
jgi:hypothetical protein